VAQVIGFIKGKSAIHLARVYSERKQSFVGPHVWARGYFVSTAGRDEAVIRDFIQRQEKEDIRLDQLGLWRERHREVAQIGAALATPPAALSGSQPKAPALPGDTAFLTSCH
jgi:hypothetical protein